jgi:hypothetical protein
LPSALVILYIVWASTASFHTFYAYRKKTKRLPDRVRAEVLRRYEQITGKKP